MRRHVPLLIAGLAMGAALGCSDVASAPTASTQPDVVQGASASLSSIGFGRTTHIKIKASGGQASIFGIYTLTYPAHAVCDPNASGYIYGNFESTVGCPSRLNDDIVVTAKLEASNGRVWVDFTPDIRFGWTNSNNPADWVTISTDIYAPFLTTIGQSWFQNHPNTFQSIGILYATSIGATPIDEVATSGEPSLATHVDFQTGRIWRRILHFTGYNIITGEPCDPKDGDPLCIPSDVDGN